MLSRALIQEDQSCLTPGQPSTATTILWIRGDRLIVAKTLQMGMIRLLLKDWPCTMINEKLSGIIP